MNDEKTRNVARGRNLEMFTDSFIETSSSVSQVQTHAHPQNMQSNPLVQLTVYVTMT